MGLASVYCTPYVSGGAHHVCPNGSVYGTLVVCIQGLVSVYCTPCLSRHAHHMCVMHTFVFTVTGSLFDVSSISAYVAVIIVHPMGGGRVGKLRS